VCVHASCVIHSGSSLTKAGSLTDIKIGDFGLASFYRPGAKDTTEVQGTLSFTAPEIFRGSNNIGTLIDR
jgi:serine/threonine protein kinase